MTSVGVVETAADGVGVAAWSLRGVFERSCNEALLGLSKAVKAADGVSVSLVVRAAVLERNCCERLL